MARYNSKVLRRSARAVNPPLFVAVTRVAMCIALLVLLLSVWIAPAHAQQLTLGEWGVPDTVAGRLANDPRLNTPVVGRDGNPVQASGYRTERGFSAAQLDSVASAFADLPPAFLASLRADKRPLIFDSGLDDFRKQVRTLGKGGSLIAVSGKGSTGIRVGQRWADLSPAFQRLAIVHELAHDFIRQNGARLHWEEIWNAELIFDDFRAQRFSLPSGRVSIYARSSAEEDFAECVVAYRYAPQVLKQLAPGRYRLLRDWVFGGKEYFAEG